MGTAADVDVDVVSRSFETVEDTVMNVLVFEGIEDVTVVDFDVVPRPVDVIVVLVNDDSVLEDVKDVVGGDIRSSARRDKTSEMSLSSGEDQLLGALDLGGVLDDRRKASSVHRRPSLRFGVGDAKVWDKFVETDGVADIEGALDGETRPGMLTGKHFDGRGFEEDHNGVDQGAS